MKNIIEFYYNIKVSEFHNIHDKILFKANGKDFILEIFDGDLSQLNDINKLGNLSVLKPENFVSH